MFTDGGLTATVLMGELGGAASPARCYTPLVGAEISLAAGADARLPLRADFEYAVLALDGAATVDGATAGARAAAVPGRAAGRRCGLQDRRRRRRLMLLGGEPFAERLVMWWNFVARDHDEIVQARAEWEAAAVRRGPRLRRAGDSGAADADHPARGPRPDALTSAD